MLKLFLYKIKDKNMNIFSSPDRLPFDLLDRKNIAKNIKNIESVEISASNVDSIGVRAFCDFEYLKEIVLPNSIHVIDDGAFRNCKKLSKINLDNVKEIGHDAFSKCHSLTKISLPNSLRKLKSGAFQNTGIEMVVLPSSLMEIGDLCFSDCYCLKTAIFDDCVSYVGCRMFRGCSSLERVKLASCMQIYDYAFSKCFKLKHIKLPSNLYEIKEGAFQDCRSLETISIPFLVSNVGKYAFSECSSLKEVGFHSKLLYGIEEGTFYKCYSLEKVTLPSSSRRIGEKAFYGCKSLKNIYFPKGIVKLENECFSNCKSIKKIVLPNSVEYIGANAFEDCSSLEEVVLPNKLEALSDGLFENCTSLKRIRFPINIESFSSRLFCNCQSLETIIVPKSVERIEDEAFKGCNSLKEIVLSKNVKYIANDAFDYSNDEAEVVIGDKRVKVGDLDIINDYNLGCCALIDNSKKECYGYLNDEFFAFSIEHLFDKANMTNRVKLLGKRDYIKLWHWNKRNKFLPHFEIIRNMPIKDIDFFYKNNNCEKWAEILKNIQISSDTTKATLFKLCYVLGVFQDSGKKRDKAVDFIKENILNIMDQYKIHEKFDAFDLKNGFDPMWAEFFMKYYKDNPNFMYNEEKDVDLLAASYNSFSEVRKVYGNKILNTNRRVDVLLPEHVFYALDDRKYTNVDSSNIEFASMIMKYGYSQQQFNNLQKWFNDAKNIEKEDLKIFISDDSVKSENTVSYELLEKDNPLGAVLGNITNCCQVAGGAGETCVEYGMTKPNSKFMTFNYKNNIIGQAWVWYDDKSRIVCLDNIEVPSRYLDLLKKDKNIKKSFVECLKRMAENFISEMENHGLGVENVTIGEGYNDVGEVLKSSFGTSRAMPKLKYYQGYSDADKQFLIKKVKK